MSESERKTQVFAVTGNPILHSKSPQMFNAAFQELGIDAVYSRLAATSAEEAIACARAIGIQGLNVTAPFKEDVRGYLDTVDESANKINAVNTITLDSESHELKGYNTDHFGVVAAIEGHGISLEGKKAVVLGAGGAGRAAVYALENAGAEANQRQYTTLAQNIGCSSASRKCTTKRVGREGYILAHECGKVSYRLKNFFRLGSKSLNLCACANNIL